MDHAPRNNAAERLLKPAALLRENCLFADSDAGADRGARMLSVISTCRLVGVDAEACLVRALDRMAERRVLRERLADLTGGPAPPIRSAAAPIGVGCLVGRSSPGRLTVGGLRCLAGAPKRRTEVSMGDKNPKSRARAKKQDAAEKEKAKVAHDQKHAPAPAAPKKGK